MFAFITNVHLLLVRLIARAVAYPFIVCIAAVFNYMSLGSAAEVGEEPAPACPDPKVEQTEWRSAELVSLGVRLKMPNKYAEKQWAVSVGNPVIATFRAGHVEEFTLQVEATEDTPLADHKVDRQSSYEGYTECRDVISGHEAVIQSFREPDVIFMDGRRYAGFSVHAVCELRPGRILRFHSIAATRQSQEELLAILRTVEVTQ
ncbi:MAG: hypothetical protein ACJ8KC_12075 [Candidatus Udaeobacter sp.]